MVLFWGMKTSPVAWTSVMEEVNCNFWSKKYLKNFCCKFFPFLVIKTLDLDPHYKKCWIRIRIRIRTETNVDPQHWNKFLKFSFLKKPRFTSAVGKRDRTRLSCRRIFWLLPPPLQSLFASFPVCRQSSLLTGEGGGSQLTGRRESLVLY